MRRKSWSWRLAAFTTLFPTNPTVPPSCRVSCTPTARPARLYHQAWHQSTRHRSDPLDAAAARHAEHWFRFLGDFEHDPPHPATQKVWGRDIHVPRASGRACHFTFDELLGRATGAADYIELMHSYAAGYWSVGLAVAWWHRNDIQKHLAQAPPDPQPPFFPPTIKIEPVLSSSGQAVRITATADPRYRSAVEVSTDFANWSVLKEFVGSAERFGGLDADGDGFITVEESGPAAAD